MGYGKLFRIPIKSIPSSIEVLYSPVAAPLRFERDKLNSNSPAKFIVQDTLNRQPRDTLRWGFGTSTSMNVLPLAVMRNKLQRKWSGALRDALKAHGYAGNGRQTDSGPDGSEKVGLAGTLFVLIHNGTGWKEPLAFLRRNADEIVKAVVQRSNHQH